MRPQSDDANAPATGGFFVAGKGMTMQETQPPWLEIIATLKLWLGLFLTWFAGSAGQVALAGAAGGAVRWWMSERRHLISGA